MTDKITEAAAVIGRFRGAHLEHLNLIREALRLAPIVVVGVGSCFQARTSRNPFTFEEVCCMLQIAFTPAECERIRFVPLRDYYDNARWVAESVKLIEAAAGTHDIQLVGHFKDKSSSYLNDFHWPLTSVGSRRPDLHATTVRKILLSGESARAVTLALSEMVHAEVMGYLRTWMQTPAYEKMVAEHSEMEAYVLKYGKGPFVATDALILPG